MTTLARGVRLSGMEAQAEEMVAAYAAARKALFAAFDVTGVNAPNSEQIHEAALQAMTFAAQYSLNLD